MITDNKPECAFAELLVSCLYNEADAAEQTRFAGHRANCESCQADWATLGGVSGAIQLWRKTEFDRLPTPKIAVAQTPSFSRWFARLPSLFAIAPALRRQTAGGFAALLIGATLLFAVGYAMLNQPASNDFAKINDEAPIAQTTVVNGQAARETEPATIQKQSENKTAVESTAFVEPITVGQNTAGNNRSRTSSRVVAQKAKMQNTPTKRAADRRPSAPRSSARASGNAAAAPVLREVGLVELSEESEDTAPRLIDLFAELDLE